MTSSLEFTISAFEQAIAEARTMFDTGQRGTPLRQLLDHARLLVDAVDRQYAAAPKGDGEATRREMPQTMRVTLETTEALLAPRLH
jgi:hypothetical protein